MRPGLLPGSPGRPPASGAAAGRRSSALEQVDEYLGKFTGGQVIDLGGAFQSTIDYVTGLGHRLYAEDLLRSLPANGNTGELPGDCLDFPPASVDVVLCWDRLQFVPEPTALALRDRIHRILAPGGMLLALFHAEPSAASSPLACRIVDGHLLHLAAAGTPRPFRPFHTRMIERFFQNFTALKFYLTRENLQEVIVRR